MFKIIECPRDAMQGLKDWIPTEQKIAYLNALLKVGFPILDCGSFVSPKAIPQMADTKQVLDGLDASNNTKLSVIVANLRGAERALEHSRVNILGFPFSVSNTFQEYNTNKNQNQAFDQIKEILALTQTTNKELVVYFSMAFGNPYQESWNTELVTHWVKKFAAIGVNQINLSDTIGAAQTKDINHLFSALIPSYPSIEFGAHFHTKYNHWHSKVLAAYQSGCMRFDGAIRGFGGCPMAKSNLVGNMPTEKLITFAQEHQLQHGLNLLDFEPAFNKSMQILD